MKKNGEANEIYFMIVYRRKEKEGEDDFFFIKNDKNPKCILNEEIEEVGQSKTFLYEKVFKYDKESKNGEVEIQFEIGNDLYIISFKYEDKFFNYDIELKKGNKFITNIAQEIINQNILDYYQKFEIYLEALKSIKNEKKLILYMMRQ